MMIWGDQKDPLACPAYAQCNNYSRTRDPSRFTTWADDMNVRSRCGAHATLIAYNNYPGWYGGVGDLTAQKASTQSPAQHDSRGFLEIGACGCRRTGTASRRTSVAARRGTVMASRSASLVR